MRSLTWLSCVFWRENIFGTHASALQTQTPAIMVEWQLLCDCMCFTAETAQSNFQTTRLAMCWGANFFAPPATCSAALGRPKLANQKRKSALRPAVQSLCVRIATSRCISARYHALMQAGSCAQACEACTCPGAHVWPPALCAPHWAPRCQPAQTISAAPVQSPIVPRAWQSAASTQASAPAFVVFAAWLQCQERATIAQLLKVAGLAPPQQKQVIAPAPVQFACPRRKQSGGAQSKA